MIYSSKPLLEPNLPENIPADFVIAGPPIPAIDRLRIMSPENWEDFVLEWAHSLKMKFSRVERCGGAGDMGRDVMGIYDSGDPDSDWENYQCKRYAHALYPSDIWIELAKLCYYTHIGAFKMPIHYYFVAPLGVGNELSRLLRRPDELKQGLLENWDSVSKRITKKEEILLGQIEDHIRSLDFRIFKSKTPLNLIDEHRTTPWHAARFGGGLPQRNAVPDPPPTIVASEAVYIRALLDAYEEALGITLAGHQSIPDGSDLLKHLGRARREFYSAEALRGFSRDNVPAGTFENLLDEVLNGIADVLDGTHENGYLRLLEVVKQAKSLPLTSNALISRITSADRGGMCHQLANEGKVKWRR